LNEATRSHSLCTIKQIKTKKSFPMYNKIKASLLIALSAACIVSCKKDSAIIDKQEQQSVVTGEQSVKLAAAQNYTLLRRGNDSLFYDNSSRLIKVKHSPTSYTQYFYGGFGDVLTAKTWSGNQLDKEITYLINPTTGLVYESTYKGFTYYSAGTVVTTRVHRYVYDANNRLIEKYNKAKPKEKLKFNYDSESDLNTIYTYNEAGVCTSLKIFAYFFLNNVKKSDRNHLNPEWIGLDTYPKIFGKFSKHLITYHVENFYDANGNVASTWSRKMDHTLDANGYPTQYLLRDQNSAIIGTVLFGYRIN